VKFNIWKGLGSVYDWFATSRSHGQASVSGPAESLVTASAEPADEGVSGMDVSSVAAEPEGATESVPAEPLVTRADAQFRRFPQRVERSSLFRPRRRGDLLPRSRTVYFSPVATLPCGVRPSI